uniref:Uncharacterized protein n=1 Tax=candidate division CPR3 bacterium TaxID=2268181 RepID=A0A7V3JAE3_UNCC3
MITALLISNILLIVYLAFKEWQTHKLLKDLTIKIMARTIDDYLMLQQRQSSSPNENTEVEPDYLPIEESPVWDDSQKFVEAIKKQ